MPCCTVSLFARALTWLKIRSVGLLVGLLVGSLSGCAYTPTSPSPFSSATSQVLKGTVYPGGITTLWLVAGRSGTFSLNLASVDPGGMTLRIGFGVLRAGHCEQRLHVDAPVSAITQLSSQVDAGTYCVEVSDLGTVGLSGAPFLLHVQFE